MIDVCCALIIDENGRVFVAQRSETMKLPLKWEFPGGKVEAQETAEACIVREIEEELGIAIQILNRLASNEHHYDDFSIRLTPFVCKTTTTTVSLKEHVNCSWVKPEELLTLDWADADVPVVHAYLKYNTMNKQMKIIIGSDHAGFVYKGIIIQLLVSMGHDVLDLGAYDEVPSDYPDHAADVAEALLAKQGDRGILICGSSVGVSIAANKFKGIRAGVCHDTYSAHQSVEHDDVNILCLGERVIGIELAKDIVIAFLNAKFSGEERHVKRLAKITAIENRV